MADRANGFADNKWGGVCRAIRDFINAFDVNPLALVAFLIVNTCIMAFLHATFDWFRVPDWWWGPSGVLFMVTFALLGKHTVGYYIASKHNSKPGESPTPTDPAAEKPPAGFAHIAAVLLLLVLSAGVIAVAHAETREEMKARFQKVSKECAERTSKELDYYNPHFLVKEKCRLIGLQYDDLIRCATERHHLRRAAACPHQWHGIGPKVKGCAKCESIAHFVNGEWLVVLADGIWVGPEPIDYPEDYGLK